MTYKIVQQPDLWQGLGTGGYANVVVHMVVGDIFGMELEIKINITILSEKAH